MACRRSPRCTRAVFSSSERDLLEQSYEMRAIIVLLDGIDEAADLKLLVEDFVTQRLVRMGVRLVVTSRPEGVRIALYERDFVIVSDDDRG